MHHVHANYFTLMPWLMYNIAFVVSATSLASPYADVLRCLFFLIILTIKILHHFGRIAPCQKAY